MFQAEELEQNKMIQCQAHKGYPLQFFNTDISFNKNQIAFCSRCVTTNLLQGKDLLFFADISDLNDSEILSNWPIVEDKTILLNLKNMLNGQKECYQDYLQIIEQFIDELQYKFNQKLIKMKKAIINQLSDNLVTKQKLIELYNNLSCKHEFQNSIEQMLQGNIQGLKQIENIIKESHKNRNQNQQILLDELKKFQENQQFFQLKFPKLMQKQLFENLKLIKQYFLNKDFRKDKTQKVEIQNSLEEFQDYISSSTLNYAQDTDYLKDYSSTNNQIHNLNKEKSHEQNFSTFQKIEKLIRDYSNLTQEFNSKEHLILNELMLSHEYEMDITDKYQFVKSLKDNCSQSNQIIKKSKDGLTKIGQINSQLMVQFFTEKAIDPSKKYTMQFEFKPFRGEEDSYKIAVGVIQISKFNFYWLDQDSVHNSDLFFSNHNTNKFNLCKKGNLFNNIQIRRSELMRKLEVQFCLKEKYFQIADYPDYRNITQANIEETQRYLPSQEYVCGIEHYSIKSIKILKFTEGYMAKN
ncbi:hypothetical protein ABPG72_014284 [Tetrahymena utriculariae]